MAKKKEKKSFSWIPQVFNFFGELIGLVQEYSEEEIERLKERVVHYTVVYGFFVLAILFILIGLVKHLEDIGFFVSEGVGFIVLGSVMVVLLAVYSMVKRL